MTVFPRKTTVSLSSKVTPEAGRIIDKRESQSFFIDYEDYLRSCRTQLVRESSNDLLYFAAEILSFIARYYRR